MRKAVKSLKKQFKNPRFVALSFVALFAAVGSYFIFFASAASPFVALNAEDANLTNGAVIGSDNGAAGGRFVQFGQIATPPPPPPPEGMPSRQEIINGAGLSNPSALKPSGSVVANTPGQVIQNLDINGVISVKADNVTIRNVRVNGSSSTAVIKQDSGVKNTTIEHCEVNVTSGGANGGIGYLGNNTIVRFCEITGYADGIKVEGGTSSKPSLYEYNYIHMSKPAGSEKHLDGMQGSGDSYYTIRYNVIDAGKSRGGNAATFNQAWYGSGCSHIYDIRIENNYLKGGNFTAYLEGGKDRAECDNNPGKWVHNYQFNNNIFDRDDVGFGYLRIENCSATTVKNNKFSDGASLGTYCGVKQ